jgi:hypothetical protein
MSKNNVKNSVGTNSSDSRDDFRNPWDPNLEFDQVDADTTSSAKIPEVGKNQAFVGMSFTIEKCRELK